AGNFSVTSNDDVIFFHSTCEATVGVGTVNGCNGRGLTINATGLMLTNVNWSSNASGGNAGTGNGGAYGGLNVTCGATSTVSDWAYTLDDGGDSVTGAAGTGGTLRILSGTSASTMSGIAHFDINGGEVTAAGTTGGNGGAGLTPTVACANLLDFQV